MMKNLGTLPSVNISRVKYFDVSDNNLVGTVPTDMFRDVKFLTKLYLGGNSFSGPVPIIKSLLLTDLDIGSNLFSGELPESSFQMSTRMFSAGGNCLSTYIPTSICNATNLNQLYLSGLGQSISCKNREPRILFNFRTLPSCIFSLPSLQKLYLAGNSYATNLNSFDIPDLIEFDISSNRVTGTIPSALSKLRVDYLDLSSNHITGTLDVLEITPFSNTSTCKAKLNRLSGELHVNIFEAFDTVDILQGSHIACSAEVTNDINYATFNCGSQTIERSLYFWISSCGLTVIFLCIVKKWCRPACRRWLDLVSTKNLFADNNMLFTNQFMGSLWRLGYWHTYTVMSLLVTTIIIYCSFKLPDGWYERYNTYAWQYQYRVSGVFLRGYYPAICLLIVHACVVYLCVGSYFRAFVVDWGIMRLNRGRFEKNEVIEEARKTRDENGIISDNNSKKEATDNVWGRIVGNRYMIALYRCLLVALFMIVTLLINVLYVIGITRVKGILKFLLDLTLVLYNTIGRYLIPYFVEFLYSRSPDSLWAGRLMAFSYSVFDIVLPFAATLIQSDSCFSQLSVLEGRQQIHVGFQYSKCTLYENLSPDINDYTMTCALNVTFSEEYNIARPFVYSGECRDAVLTNFLFMVIIFSSFQAFLYPIVYFLITRDIDHLEHEFIVICLGYKINFGTLEQWILSSRYMKQMMSQIWSSFLMLLTYGILNPYCLVAILVSTLSQITFLRTAICHYYNLGLLGEEDDKQKTRLHLEVICKNCQNTIHGMLWPGICMSSFTFSCYVFDMAYDEDVLDGRAMMISFTIFVVSALSTLIGRMSFYYQKHLLEKKLTSNIFSTEIISRSERSSKSPSFLTPTFNPLGMISTVSSTHNHL